MPPFHVGNTPGLVGSSARKYKGQGPKVIQASCYLVARPLILQRGPGDGPGSHTKEVPNDPSFCV